MHQETAPTGKPLEFAVRFNAAARLWQSGQKEDAVVAYLQLLEEYPDTPSLLGMIGTIYTDMKQWAEAVPYFKRATELRPHKIRPSQFLYHCLWKLGRQRDALLEIKRFLLLQPSPDEHELTVQELADGQPWIADKSLPIMELLELLLSRAKET